MLPPLSLARSAARLSPNNELVGLCSDHFEYPVAVRRPLYNLHSMFETGCVNLGYLVAPGFFLFNISMPCLHDRTLTQSVSALWPVLLTQLFEPSVSFLA